MADPKQRALEEARALEKKGNLERAIELYLRAGALPDAARVMMSLKRFEDAGQLLLRNVGVEPSRFGTLGLSKKKLALQAAICFARANQVGRAVEMFVALGEHVRAVETLERSGDREGAARLRAHLENPRAAADFSSAYDGSPRLERAMALEASGRLEQALDTYVHLKQLGHAARVARTLRRHEQAGDLFLEVGAGYDAALSFLEIGDTGRALEALTAVSRDDPKYREAAVLAIDLASNLGFLDLRLEQFLSRFVSGGPESDRELASFYTLGRLLRRKDYLETAEEAFQRILQRAPDFRDSRQQLDEIEAELRGSPRVYERIVKDETSFRPALLPSVPPQPIALDPAFLEPLEEPQPAEISERAPAPPPPMRRISMPASPPPAPDAEPGDTEKLQPPPPQPAPAPARASQLPPGREPRTHFLDAPPDPRPRAEQTARESATPGPASRSPSSGSSPGGANRPKAAAPKAGTMLADRYQLVKKLGRGGMAVVYEATDVDLDVRIAIKVFNQLDADDEKAIARLKQELVLTRSLSHPNIVRLYDFGATETYWYITMELLTGRVLKQLLGQPLPLAVGVDYLIQACAGLQIAHDRGIVHRDVKPANLFITDDGVLKVMDFGIAKNTASAGITTMGSMAGTPKYMSPEQINGFSTVTAAADLYALGVVAYEMFAGAPPFVHTDPAPILVMHLMDVPEPLRARNPAVPAELEAIIMKLLQKEPKMRYASPKALAADLTKLIEKF